MSSCIILDLVGGLAIAVKAEKRGAVSYERIGTMKTVSNICSFVPKRIKAKIYLPVVDTHESRT